MNFQKWYDKVTKPKTTYSPNLREMSRRQLNQIDAFSRFYDSRDRECVKLCNSLIMIVETGENEVVSNSIYCYPTGNGRFLNHLHGVSRVS